MTTPVNEQNDKQNKKDKYSQIKPIAAPCYTLDTSAPIHWLELGWQDLKQAPKQSLSYGLIMLSISYLISAAAWYAGNLGLFLGLLTGFVYLGPILALTLYAISNRLEKGLPISLRLSMLDAKGQVSNTIIYTGFLTVIFLVWARAASMVHIFFPTDGDSTWLDMAYFLGIGSAIGSLFCIVIFTVSCFSLPMIIDREVDPITAIISSTNAVLSNKPAMLVWAIIIGLVMFIGAITAYLAFIVLLPLMGHATYHSYKQTIDASAWPERTLSTHTP